MIYPDDAALLLAIRRAARGNGWATLWEILAEHPGSYVLDSLIRLQRDDVLAYRRVGNAEEWRLV